MREADEVELRQDSGRIAFAVEELLPLTDHAQAAVVDDDADEVFALACRGEQLHACHLEATVAGDMHHLRIRLSKGCTKRTRQAEAHRAAAATRQMMTRLIDYKMLRCPHLVLSNIGYINRMLALKGAAQLLHQPGSGESVAL